jgi:YD repeat-containing protein
LVKWTDQAHGEVRFGRTADGHLSRITDAVGRTLGLFRNGAGQVTRLLRPDGTALVMTRNPAGDVISVEVDGELIKIERDPLGQAIRAGELVWTRDIVGRVHRIERPGLRLHLTRDPGGRLRSLRSGDRTVIVQRDAAGWPIIWSDGDDGDPDVILQRDASGRVVVEQVGAQKTTVFRNSLGAVDRVKSELGEWRWMRDASGQVLRMHGPEGMNIGFDRDGAGRVVLMRYPSGAIMRRVYKKNQIKETLTDSAGGVVDVRNTVSDVHDQLVQVTDAKGRGWAWRRDPNGQVVSIERSDGGAWSWTMDGVQGPEGELLLHDEDGRLMEARMGLGPKAWGVAGDTMSVHRDSLGRMSRISGEFGAVELRWDAAGWLSGTRNSTTGERWRFERDVRGRLCSVGRGDEQHLTLWHPDAERGEVWGLLATQTETGTIQRVLGRDGGGAVRTRNAEDTVLEELVVDVGGRPAWHMAEDAPPIALVATPLSRMNTAVPGGVAPGGTWTPWPGSPAFGAGVAIDPVSGESVDGELGWPWATRFAQQDNTRRALDPAAWAPESPWANPLALLTSLDIVGPIDDGEWRSIGASPTAFAWLPDSLDSGDPPLGPAPGAMPMASVDPITAAFLRAVLPGGSPPSADLPRAVVMDAELGLPWLPPGLAVPGLHP